MGRITDFTWQHPDKFLALSGGAAAFVTGLWNLGPLAALGFAFAATMFTFMVAQIEPHRPEYGPHQ